MEATYAGISASLRPLAIVQRPTAVAELQRIADGVIPDLVQRQIDAGVDVVTDGEVRRSSFISAFYDAVDGLGRADEADAGAGQPLLRDSSANQVVEKGVQSGVRLHKTSSPAAEEVAFMRAVTDYPFKLTLPAPSYFLTDFVPTAGSGYASRRDFLTDVVSITSAIVAEVVAAGARWLQFDFPVYPALVADAGGRHGSLLTNAIREGETFSSLLELALEADAAVTAPVPDGLVTALHLCRGNLGGGFWSGSLERIAEQMFARLPHDRFLFEWEDVGRQGDYEPIRHVPKGKIMAMGVVSTKTPELESEEEIIRRIEAAAKYLGLEQLAVCPQCGFASLFGDRLVEAEDAQWRKLELIGNVADRVWGAG